MHFGEKERLHLHGKMCGFILGGLQFLRQLPCVRCVGISVSLCFARDSNIMDNAPYVVFSFSCTNGQQSHKHAPTNTVNYAPASHDETMRLYNSEFYMHRVLS